MKMGFLSRVAAPAGRSPKAQKDDLYEMANLFPRHTGLPVTVWVSVKGGARHAARVKVCRRPGDRMDASDTASVGIQPTPELVAGSLEPEIEAVVLQWVSLNSAALLDYWNGLIDTVELIGRLQKI